MPRLTKRLIDTTTAPATGETILMDDQLPGFGCRVYASGRAMFFVRYQASGRRIRLKLGWYGALTVDQARTQAQAALGQVAMGLDPATLRRRAGGPTLADVATRYLTEHAVPKKKPRSVEEDRNNLRVHILPALGTRAITDITPRDIMAFHHSLHKTPIAANRALTVLSMIFRLVEHWELRPRGSNPTTGIQRYTERKRERFLTPEELARLSRVLAEVEAEQSTLPSVPVCIRLLLFTGARLGEILTLRWEAVNLSTSTARLTDSKTGRRTVYLPPPAVEVLQGIPRTSRWVVEGKTPDRHLAEPHRRWWEIRERAGIPDVRLHDLRHTYASLGVQAGLSLPLIGALLGHTNQSTTARYSHLSEPPVHQAAHLVGELMRKAMGG